MRLVSETPFFKEQITSGRASASGQISVKRTISNDIFDERVKLLQASETNCLKDFCTLALSHYNLSIWSEPRSGFINMMICLEALYNTDPQELRKTISHRIANLLGDTDEQRDRIYNDIYTLYKKRNDLVHGLKTVSVTYEEMKLLKLYSKYSLLAFSKINPQKEAFSKKLDKSIYCEKSRIEIQEQNKDIIEELEQELNNY